MVACNSAEASEPLQPGVGLLAQSAHAASAQPIVRDEVPPAGPCPSDMALIEGAFCPQVTQRCLRSGDISAGDASDSCQQYEQARCLSKQRTPLRYCMDHYEWPNKKGEKPLTLVTWHSARAFCKERDKRLCTANEFSLACEGEAISAHVYGNTRDPNKCHIDQRYIQRTHTYKPYQECLADAACRREYERLDRRLPSGSRPECVNAEGVYDLNGNVNEWVMVPGRTAPRRSGLKGGWWGPVRNRCRPLTTFHPEHDYGYEAGFRCCKDAD